MTCHEAHSRSQINFLKIYCCLQPPFPPPNIKEYYGLQPPYPPQNINEYYCLQPPPPNIKEYHGLQPPFPPPNIKEYYVLKQSFPPPNIKEYYVLKQSFPPPPNIKENCRFQSPFLIFVVLGNTFRSPAPSAGTTPHVRSTCEQIKYFVGSVPYPSMAKSGQTCFKAHKTPEELKNALFCDWRITSLHYINTCSVRTSQITQPVSIKLPTSSHCLEQQPQFLPDSC